MRSRKTYSLIVFMVTIGTIDSAFSSDSDLKGNIIFSKDAKTISEGILESEAKFFPIIETLLNDKQKDIEGMNALLSAKQKDLQIVDSLLSDKQKFFTTAKTLIKDKKESFTSIEALMRSKQEIFSHLELLLKEKKEALINLESLLIDKQQTLAKTENALMEMLAKITVENPMIGKQSIVMTLSDVHDFWHKIDDCEILCRSVANAPNATLVIDCEDEDVIKNYVLFAAIQQHNNIKFLASSVTKIGNCFLSQCTGFSTIELSPFKNVTQIGNYFLSNCTSLESLDLRPFEKVTQIGNYFLSNCTSLERLDLTPLKKVTKIGDYFLANCISLKRIELSSLREIENTGDGFLFSCDSLETLELTPLQNVTQIGNFFVASCTSLKRLDLGIFTKVTKIGDNFLDSCRRLESLELTPLQNVKNIGDLFLSQCNSLKDIDLKPLLKVRKIGDFILGCVKLSEGPLATKKDIDKKMNNKNQYIEEMILLKDVNSKSKDELKKTKAFLIVLDEEGYRDLDQSEVCELLESALSSSKNATIVIDCGEREKIENSDLIFLSDDAEENIKINSLEFIGRHIVALEDSFLRNCTSLISLKLSSFKQLKHIGDKFLEHCENLNEPTIEHIRSLKMKIKSKKNQDKTPPEPQPKVDQTAPAVATPPVTTPAEPQPIKQSYAAACSSKPNSGTNIGAKPYTPPSTASQNVNHGTNISTQPYTPARATSQNQVFPGWNKKK